MLIRDPHNANSRGIARMMREIQNGSRQVAVFLLDVALGQDQYITSDTVLGIGWDGQELRWLGDSYSPKGCGSFTVDKDMDVATVMLSNRLAREALKLEKQIGLDVWIWAQPHIITPADSAKLFRYMNKYPSIA